VTPARHYAKLCELEDFEDPALRDVMREIAPRRAGGPADRKLWEYGMGALFLEEMGHLHDGSAILDVGAGADPILYWLANRAGRTVGVDIYGEGGFADAEGELAMLHDPGSHAPYEYRRERLEARSMDARALGFPDETFDAVVSFSSIEHFGGRRGIARSAAEIGRVLRPGGHAFLVTEMFVDYGVLARPVVQAAIRAVTLGRKWRTATPRQRAWPEVLTEQEIERWIVRPSGLRLMQPLRTTVGPASRAAVLRLGADGTPAPGVPADSPRVLLSILGSAFTSVGLPLAKPAS
jgi:SAM-dependent methyltransferase